MGARRPTRGRRPVRLTDPPRQAALDLILAVETADAYANLSLPRLLRDRGITGVDAAFATEIGYGTLRWQGVLDEVIAAAARRPAIDLDPPVRAALRLGAYQLLHTRTPTHAAVATSVELVRANAGERPVGFANAVLRRVAEQPWGGWVDRLAPTDAVGRLAFTHGYPEWVATAFLDALGGDAAELALALAADRPVTHLVARPRRVTRDALLAQVGERGEPGPWSPYAVRLSGGDPAAVPAVRDGSAGVQDEGSQLAALPLALAPVDGDERWWLDVCAGPGGKSALLAGLRPPEVHLVAADLQPHRAALVAQALRDEAETSVLVADGTAPPWRPGIADRVLVDAPCTGLGALRRRPEVRWRRRPADVERLVPLQRRLLAAALDAARPGGLVAYITCSPHRSETRDVVSAVLAGRPGIQRVDVRAYLPDMPDIGPGPDVQLWPHRHGTDAMYVVLLRTDGASRPAGP